MHGSYICENKRTMGLFQDLGNRPLVLIRFNPDSYKENGVKIHGCFHKNSRGLEVLDPAQASQWMARVEALKKAVVDALEYKEDQKDLKTIFLFYNDDE